MPEAIGPLILSGLALLILAVFIMFLAALDSVEGISGNLFTVLGLVLLVIAIALFVAAGNLDLIDNVGNVILEWRW